MRTIIFQALEFTVLIPGMLLAYLPVNSSLKQKPKKMIAWMLPLLVIISFLSGFVCNRFHLSTRMILLPLLFLTFILYQATLRISLWKSVSIYLAVCAVFSCFNSLARATSAMIAGILQLLFDALVDLLVAQMLQAPLLDRSDNVASGIRIRCQFVPPYPVCNETVRDDILRHGRLLDIRTGYRDEIAPIGEIKFVEFPDAGFSLVRYRHTDCFFGIKVIIFFQSLHEHSDQFVKKTPCQIWFF